MSSYVYKVSEGFSSLSFGGVVALKLLNFTMFKFVSTTPYSGCGHFPQALNLSDQWQF